MQSVREYIESGILEQYVLGHADAEESAEVERMAALHAEVRDALDDVSDSLEAFARANVVAPHATVRPFLLATMNYMQRMQSGEEPEVPPTLGPDSTAADYTKWLDREDFQAPESVSGIYARIIAATKQETTVVVWISELAPEELHDDEHEKFLILEGTCDIEVAGEKHSLKAGDYFAIPLHKKHELRVTSKIPCKAILQRTAA